MAKQKKLGSRPKPVPQSAKRSSEPAKCHLYTVTVYIIGGPMADKFAKKNPVMSRTIQIRGDQTLENLHQAIFDAFDRFDEHLYEFQFGKGPMNPKGTRYVMPMAFDEDAGDGAAGSVDETTIESLGLKKGRAFGYWFDFGDDWWHQIDVDAVEANVPPAKYPQVTNRVGKSPPQYMDSDE